MSKTKELLLAKYRPEALGEGLSFRPQPQEVQKAALPSISQYEDVDAWLGAVVPMVSHWPQDLAKSVLKNMITAHMQGV